MNGVGDLCEDIERLADNVRRSLTPSALSDQTGLKHTEQ